MDHEFRLLSPVMHVSDSNPSSTKHTATLKPRPPHVHRFSLELNDVDQGRAAFGKLHGDAQFEPLPGIPFQYALNVTSYGSIHSTKEEFTGGGHAIVPAIADRYIFSRQVAGTVNGKQAGKEFFAVPGRGFLLFSAGLSGSLHLGSGNRAQNIIIDRNALETHFALLTGETRRTPFCFEVMLDVSQPRTAALDGLAELFRQEIERPDRSLATLAALRDALLTAILTGAIHDAHGCFGPPTLRVAPACVRRVEEYIVAHVADPITLEDLVAVAGVPARSLQAAFQKCRGTSPRSFLRQKRFELARQRLLDTSARTSVTDVIRELGLGNPGRFSIEYKRRFGESPSETIARVARR